MISSLLVIHLDEQSFVRHFQFKKKLPKNTIMLSQFEMKCIVNVKVFL